MNINKNKIIYQYMELYIILYYIILYYGIFYINYVLKDINKNSLKLKIHLLKGYN